MSKKIQKPNLTKPMRRVLEELRRGTFLHYESDMGWFLRRERGDFIGFVHSNTILALELRGWISEKKITPAGRKALKERGQ